MRSILVAAIGLAAATGPAAARGAIDGAKQLPEFVVNCYDEERDLVVRELASNCHGRIVTKQEGDAIENRRTERLDREIRNDGQPVPPGTSALRKIGTAFFVGPEGKLITNYHVVVDCKALVVESGTSDQSGRATIEATDAGNDLALLDTTLPALQVAAFDRPGSVESGAFVAAIGYPDQGLPPRVPLLTRGTLVSPNIDGAQWSAALVFKGEVRAGESGGPIVNAYGLVIGITRAKLNVPLIYSRTGDIPEDYGFGIPNATVLAFLAKNGVPIGVTPRSREQLDSDSILSDASRYVVRVACWE